jgi:NDP-sugar pyrophosphorylase family protein
MTVYENRGQYDSSNVWFEGGKIRVYDKKKQLPQMRYIDYGLGLLHADVLRAWPRDAVVDLADVYGRLVATGELAGYEVSQRFYEIGSPAGLKELDALLRGGE